MRLQTATNGKVSIEFVRGTDIDTYADYRFINEAGTFKFQYEDEAFAYNDAGDVLGTSRFTGNVGIGTAPHESYNLDIYNQSTARIRIQSSSDSGATSSIEFRKGIVADVWSDYRLINDNGTFKLQYENNDFPYADATNIITWNRTNLKDSDRYVSPYPNGPH